MRLTHGLASAAAAAVLLVALSPAWAQFPPQLTMADVVIDRGAPSTARGAPQSDAPHTVVGPIFGAAFIAPGAEPPPPIFGARDGGVPEGITPLDRDIFTTTDFYADKDLWTDKRYYRCVAPEDLELMWQTQFQRADTGTNPAIGEDPPRTIAWGQCNVDYPREAIVSPYPFKTAQEQYDALMAEAKSRGGPTLHTMADVPAWNGAYLKEGFGTAGGFGGREANWHWGNLTQIPTYLSLLTPEYQQRFVQQEYHYAHNQPEYPGSYCWPEGYIRQYFSPFGRAMVAPEAAQFWTNTSEQILTTAYIGREFNMDGAVPNLSGDLRQWFGDTIGFWDGDILVTWTSNIKGWYSHGWYEYSDQLQAIDVYSPINGKDGKFVGLEHEAILYDPVAFAEPLRVINNWQKLSNLNEGMPFTWRECIPTYYPIKGEQTGVTPGQTIEYTIPDLNGRPWAEQWETWYEKDMAAKPKQEDVLSGF